MPEKSDPSKALPQEAPAPAEPGQPAGRRNLPALLLWIAILLALLALAAKIFEPFFTDIILALVLATLGQPFYSWILRRIGPARRRTAAGITCLALVLVVILPLGWIAWSAGVQAVEGVEKAARGSIQVSHWLEAKPWFIEQKKDKEWLQKTWSQVESHRKMLEDYLQKVDAERARKQGAAGDGAPAQGPKPDAAKPPGAPDEIPQGDRAPGGLPEGSAPFLLDLAKKITLQVRVILANTAQVLIHFCLMLFILFYFLKDGPEILQSFQGAIPMSEENKGKIMDTFRQVTKSIIRGSLGTAAAQGAIAALAFLVVGIPAVFWGFMVGLSSLIPPIGTGLILLPVTVYLFLEGSWGMGIFMVFVWAVIGMLDNVLRPFLVGKGLRTHPLWLLLSIIGGIGAFGPLGLLYGPLVLVLLTTLLKIFVREEALADAAAATAEASRSDES